MSPRARVALLAVAALAVFSPLAVGVVPDAQAPRVSVALGVALALTAALLARRPRAGSRAALVLAAAGGALACGDLGVRLVVPRARLAYRIEEQALVRWPPLPKVRRYAPLVTDERTTWGDLAAMSGRPDVREPRRVRFASDERGFRNDPARRTSDPDVIVLGDSFGAGVGTTQERTLAVLLAGLTGRSVDNLSVSGAGPWHEWVTLIAEWPSYATRSSERRRTLVWVLFSGNDLDEPFPTPGSEELLRFKGFLSRVGTHLTNFRHASPAGRLVRAALAAQETRGLVVARGGVLFYEPYLARAQRPRDEVAKHPNLARLRETVAAVASFARRVNLDVLVVLAPSKAEVHAVAAAGATPFEEEVGPILTAAGMRFLPLRAELVREAAARGDLLYWRDDTHWNETGHEVVTRRVASALSGR